MRAVLGMTTYKCRVCGESWSQGPTRDYNPRETCFKCLKNPELNPDNELVRGLHGQWHVLVGVIISKFNLAEIVLTNEDAAKFQRDWHDCAVLAHDKKDGLHLMLVTMEQAQALAEGEVDGGSDH